MNIEDKQFTVRIDEPADSPAAIRKFVFAVSQALTALWQKIKSMRPSTYVKGTASTASLSMALLDPATGSIVFLPGVRFVVPGSSDVNVGFELDVSGAIGAGIGGTAQGYMANYGNLFGSKLTAGMTANNETANIPRLDLGFKVQRGATLEFYGNDGTGNDRAGQMRATLGPDGRLIIYHNVSPDHWEVLGGFGENHEFVCGYRNTEWPTGAASNPFSVYGRTGSVSVPGNYTVRPMATISDAGEATVKSLKIEDGTNSATPTKSVTLTLTGAPDNENLVFQVQRRQFGDGTYGYVLCSPTS